MSKNLHIDHLVYAAPDLAAAVADIEERFGVAPTPGGAHVGLGTFNALLGLGGRTYLEIVEPSLVAWCASPQRPLVDVVQAAREAGFDPGDVRAMSRQRPDGVLLEWELTLMSLPIPEGGVLPFFIDWGRTVHPTADMPIGGTLMVLDLFHPQPRTIDLFLSAVSDESQLGDEETNITLNYSDHAKLTAEILTANGLVILH
jgi:hypothetical protein